MSPSQPSDPRSIVELFDLRGTFVSLEPYGSGHINQTFRSVFLEGGRAVRYIHQRINESVFTRPDLLMENIERVLTHQHRKIAEFHRSDPGRRAMTLIRTRDGLRFARDQEGGAWRTFRFIEETQSLDILETVDQAREIARAIGVFQLDLADFPPPRLHETIARFHDAGFRFDTFRSIVEADPEGRASSVQAEIEWYLSHEDQASSVSLGLKNGTVPERISHNDTKANNVLLGGGEGLCVIDLDTVMPGSLLYDFGDLVRTGTGTVGEDHPDSSDMSFDTGRFRGLTQGFCGETLDILQPSERSLLPQAGLVMATVIGVRFLTDYLQGDSYFKTTRPGHNLDRCRTQIALVRSMERQKSEIDDICEESLQERR